MKLVIKVYTCFFNMMKETLFIIEKLHIILFMKRYIVNFRPFSKLQAGYAGGSADSRDESQSWQRTA